MLFVQTAGWALKLMSTDTLSLQKQEVQKPLSAVHQAAQLRALLGPRLPLFSTGVALMTSLPYKQGQNHMVNISVLTVGPEYTTVAQYVCF